MNTALKSTVIALCLSVFGAQADIKSAVNHPDRPISDIRLDSARKPAEVLEFFDIQPGMKVMDVFAGEGYYTELLNHLVGKSGHVTMYNHAPWEAYSKQGSDKRIANGRLSQVSQLMYDVNTLKLPDDSYDAAIMVLGMHDLYLSSEKSVDGFALDPQAFFKALYEGMKPGAVFGVVEHLVAPGEATNPDLHRMSKGHIIEVLTDAGFKLDAESNLLRNGGDDFSKLVFAPSVRRKTDRAVLRFRKP